MPEPQPSEVIGRAHELAAVDRMLARATDGLAALVFEGKAGIGKTALWDAARVERRRRDRRRRRAGAAPLT